MKVLAIVPSVYDTSPGQRFRIEQWEPLLAEGGVEITYAAFETPELRRVLYSGGKVVARVLGVLRSMANRRRDAANAADFDLVYIFREAAILGPPWLERRMHRSGVPMIFDFDDAVFVSYKSPANGYLSYLKFPAKTGEVIRLCAHVMAGNEYLAEYSRKFNKQVTVIPTTIDTDKYTVEKRPENNVPVIGWSGSFSTVQHLDTLREALQELATTERFVLRVIGTSDYELPGVEVDAVAWSSETELDDLRAMDIGVMPLPDEEWSRGKCGLKALQYMALGIPTICSPVGVNSTIIDNDRNGFIADNKGEWVEKLRRMLHSRDLRERVGQEGRRTVEERYSARVTAPRVLEIFKNVAATRGITTK